MAGTLTADRSRARWTHPVLFLYNHAWRTIIPAPDGGIPRTGQETLPFGRPPLPAGMGSPGAGGR